MGTGQCPVPVRARPLNVPEASCRKAGPGRREAARRRGHAHPETDRLRGNHLAVTETLEPVLGRR